MKETSEGYMKRVSRSLTVLVVISLFLGLNSCATGKILRTEVSESNEVTGTFTLILYGCRYHGDMTNVAVLAKEDIQHPFEVFAPEFDYTIQRNIPAKEALKGAERFLGCSYPSRQLVLRKIIEIGGNTIGYEMRPLYSSMHTFGDVLDTSYIANGKVKVIIRLKQEVERQLMQ